MCHSFTMGMNMEANNGQKSALKTHWLDMSAKFVLGIIIYLQQLKSDNFNVVHFANRRLYSTCLFGAHWSTFHCPQAIWVIQKQNQTVRL